MMRLRIKDLKIEMLRRSGPGGQHRNRRATGVRLTHLPTGVTVMATERRSQKANLEAAKEIAYQLRFRNIGGLIVIDFIDMERKSNRERVFLALKEALSKDRAKTNILPMSDLGLIEMTRKRTRANLNSLLTEPCSYCDGSGFLKSRQTVCYELFRDLERECATSGEGGQVTVMVNPEIDSYLREEEQESVIELEKRTEKRIIFTAKKNFHLEHYEITV